MQDSCSSNFLFQSTENIPRKSTRIKKPTLKAAESIKMVSGASVGSILKTNETKSQSQQRKRNDVQKSDLSQKISKVN